VKKRNIITSKNYEKNDIIFLSEKLEKDKNYRFAAKIITHGA